jgi:glycosyltransferase involved in cell wall biosynthesis
VVGESLNAALDAAPLTLSSGGLLRFVTELSLALAREFPQDTYQLLSDQPFDMPCGSPSNLVRGPRPDGASRWWLWGIRQSMKQSGAQLFHGTNFEVPYLGAAPSILTIHDLSPWRDPTWHDAASRVRRRTPWLVRLRRARTIVTVSEAVRREVISFFGVPSARVRAIPLAASCLFRPMPETTQPARPFFLFVGTLEPRKNVAALVEAWRATKEQTGADLAIAGRTRADFVPLHPENGLKLLGEVSDPELPRLYSQALAFVYPTHYEGFGLPVLEAMQCGCPVITSRDPAVSEVSAGAAIHANGPLELADALLSIASRPDLRAELKSAGLARASAFSWKATARATRSLYAELIGAQV